MKKLKLNNIVKNKKISPKIPYLVEYIWQHVNAVVLKYKKTIWISLYNKTQQKTIQIKDVKSR